MAVPSAQQECAAAGCDDCRHCDNNGQGAVLRRRGFRLHGRGFPGGLWHSCIAGAGFLRWGLPGWIHLLWGRSSRCARLAAIGRAGAGRVGWFGRCPLHIQATGGNGQCHRLFLGIVGFQIGDADGGGALDGILPYAEGQLVAAAIAAPALFIDPNGALSLPDTDHPAGQPGILVAGQLQAGFIAADVKAERRDAGDIVQAERHGEFFLRLHILSGDLDLQPRGFRRQGRHAQQQRHQGQKVFYFFHGLPPLIPIKWIMSACGHDNLPGEIWDWVILYFSLILPSDFP